MLWYPCIIHYYVFNGAGNPLNFFNLFFHSIFLLIFPGIQLWFSFVCTAAHCSLNNHTMTHLLSVFLSSPCSARSGFIVCASSRGLSSLFVSSCSCLNPISTSASFQQGGFPSWWTDFYVLSKEFCCYRRGLRAKGTLIHCLGYWTAVSLIPLAL